MYWGWWGVGVGHSFICCPPYEEKARHRQWDNVSDGVSPKDRHWEGLTACGEGRRVFVGQKLSLRSSIWGNTCDVLQITRVTNIIKSTKPLVVAMAQKNLQSAPAFNITHGSPLKKTPSILGRRTEEILATHSKAVYFPGHFIITFSYPWGHLNSSTIRNHSSCQQTFIFFTSSRSLRTLDR